MTQSSARSIRFAPVFTWAIIQLGALTAGACGWPLWAHHPAPRESLAAHEMLAMQIVATAMLFPLLLVNVTTTVVVVAIAWPFLQLAGLLAATPQENVWRASMYVTLWIAGLFAWTRLLRSREAALFAVGVTQLVTLGAAVLWYLHCEAIPADGVGNGAVFGSLLGGLAQLSGHNLTMIPWLEAAIPLLFSGSWQILRRMRLNRVPLAPTS